MRMLRTVTVILFLCCRTYTASDSPDVLNDFFNLLNGKYDNFDQDKEEGGDNNNTIQIIMKPIYVYAINKNPVLYFEESINKSIYRLLVLNVTKIPNSHFVVFTQLNFTDHRKYKPGSFDPDSLANLPREYFRTHEDCVSYFEQLSRGIFEGHPADCRHTAKRQHPTYCVTITCDGIRIASTDISAETATPLRYYLKLRRPRFPQKVVPEDYVSSC